MPADDRESLSSEIVSRAHLDALGMLDEREQRAFEAAFEMSTAEVKAQIRREQERWAPLESLLPAVDPPPDLRERLIDAVMAATVAQGSTVPPRPSIFSRARRWAVGRLARLRRPRKTDPPSVGSRDAGRAGPDLRAPAAIRLSLTIPDHADPDKASAQIVELYRNLAAAHILLGGSGLVIEDWGTFVASDEPVGAGV